MKDLLEQEKLKQKLEAENDLKALQEAILTMRKTEWYGYSSKPDFEFPTANDLLQMTNTKLIKIKDLKYKKSTADNSEFGAF